MIRRLNPKEEMIMTILWNLKNAFVQDIVNEFPESKPHYNTISSIVRKLEEEGYIGHKTYGRAHKYFPVVKKKAYRSALFDHLFENYFKASKKKFLNYSFEKLGLSSSELKRIIKNK